MNTKVAGWVADTTRRLIAPSTQRGTESTFMIPQKSDTTCPVGTAWCTSHMSRISDVGGDGCARTMAGFRCPSWCPVDHESVGMETRSDGAEILIHEAEFGMVDLVQEQVQGQPLHESEMKIRLHVDQVSIIDAHTLIENLNHAVCVARNSR